MCLECGCSETDGVTIDGKPINKDHHSHHHSHDHDHSHEHDSRNDAEKGREISIKQEILHKNNHIAEHNREHLSVQGIFSLNWISAPGSGKTALLEWIIKHYSSEFTMYVIEGDQQTSNDSQRIRNAGAESLQINTGAACHLDAEMIHHALHQTDLKDTRLLIIENVGNMVCPTAYDLGENLKIAVISCPEGDDKPAKYPDLLIASDVLLINKTDLLPYLDFDLDRCISLSKKVNPEIAVFPVSAKTGDGIEEFVNWLKEKAGF